MKRLFRDAGLPVVPGNCAAEGLGAGPLGRSEEIEKRCATRCLSSLPTWVIRGITKVHKPRELQAAMTWPRNTTADSLWRRPSTRGRSSARYWETIARKPPAGEIIPVNGVYDYEAKYIKEGSEIVIPARLSARQNQTSQELAVRAFKPSTAQVWAEWTSCWTASRKNLRDGNQHHPGFTSISMYPKLWEASGVPTQDCSTASSIWPSNATATRRARGMTYGRSDKQADSRFSEGLRLLM